MSVCKKIAERHGGRIWIESEVGTGTVFYSSLRPAEIEKPESESNE